MNVHVQSAIVLFAASALGCWLPLFQRNIKVTPIRPFSTGIIFGVALCHLLPDASQILNTSQLTVYILTKTHLQSTVDNTNGLYDTLPVAETLLCFGIFLMLVIDQCIPCPHHLVPSEVEDGELKQLLPTTTVMEGTKCSHHGAIAIPAPTMCNGNHTNTTNSKSKLPNAKVYATEAAIAVHSIVIGMTMGLNPCSKSLIGFTIAMMFHQLFEGIALAMICQQGSLSATALWCMILTFASSLPVGIGIGVLLYHNLQTTNNTTDDTMDTSTILFQGIPNAIAAGMLLHIGFELLLQDFNHTSTNIPIVKLILSIWVVP